jgi:putative multiple sugar transport system ATP-binding protein
MVGREMKDRFPKREHNVSKEIGLEVKNWTVYHPLYEEKIVCNKINFHVNKGEIVGFAGLQGAGRTELVMSIFGHSYGQKITGTLIVKGKEMVIDNTRAAINAGIAYLTEDRKGNGLILPQSIRVNTTLAKTSKVSRNGIFDDDKERIVSDEYQHKLNIKCSSIEQFVANLSGGNQQKVLLAKWMFADPEILLLDEPTRGIDVGAKYEIYCIMNQLVKDGKSVVMISSEMPELLGMCDRIYIMNEGRIAGELSSGEATQELIMSCILQNDKKNQEVGAV